MNKEWSELNKHMQEKLRKEQTYREGIETLLVLRGKRFCAFSIEIMHLSSHILHLGSSHIDIQQNIR